MKAQSKSVRGVARPYRLAESGSPFELRDDWQSHMPRRQAFDVLAIGNFYSSRSERLTAAHGELHVAALWSSKRGEMAIRH